MTTENDTQKYCITCRANGHTYIECPRAPFSELLAAGFGLPDISGQRESVMRELAAIAAENEWPDDSHGSLRG